MLSTKIKPHCCRPRPIYWILNLSAFRHRLRSHPSHTIIEHSLNATRATSTNRNWPHEQITSFTVTSCSSICQVDCMPGINNTAKFTHTTLTTARYCYSFWHSDNDKYRHAKIGTKNAPASHLNPCPFPTLPPTVTHFYVLQGQTLCLVKIILHQRSKKIGKYF